MANTGPWFGSSRCQFFKAILGPNVSLVRARVANRWSEAVVGPEPLDKLRDASVTRVDPTDAEEAFERAYASGTAASSD